MDVYTSDRVSLERCEMFLPLSEVGKLIFCLCFTYCEVPQLECWNVFQSNRSSPACPELSIGLFAEKNSSCRMTDCPLKACREWFEPRERDSGRDIVQSAQLPNYKMMFVCFECKPIVHLLIAKCANIRRWKCAFSLRGTVFLLNKCWQLLRANLINF